MTGIGVVATGFYGFTEEITDDQYLAVTQLVYDRVPAEAIEETLLMLGLCSRVDYLPEVTEDLTHDGALCKAGRHANISANWYLPTDRPGYRCLPCRKENDRLYRAHLKSGR